MNEGDSSELVVALDRLNGSAALASLAGFANDLPRSAWPDCITLNRTLGARAGVRFVTPLADGLDYETRIATRGEVATRAHDLHDLFNALMWARWPQAKRVVSTRHAALRTGLRGTRGAARDALTLFDENGVLWVTADDSLGDLLRAFRLRELFVTRRAEVLSAVRCFVFGHALAVKLLAPYPTLTGHALIMGVGPEVVATLGSAADALDARLAALLNDPATLPTPRALQPLPVLGVPGWWPANEAPSFYDDERCFRPGRRGE